MHDIPFFVRVADRVRPTVSEVLIGSARHGVVPRQPLDRMRLSLAWALAVAWAVAVAPILHQVAAWLAVRMDFAAHDALHAAHFVLVHADDGVRCVRLASRRR